MKELEALNEYLKNNKEYDEVSILKATYSLMIKGLDLRIEIWENLDSTTSRYYATAIISKEMGGKTKVFKEIIANPDATIKDAFLNLELKIRKFMEEE